MRIKIKPGTILGTIIAQPSKSITHRAIMLASIANGTSLIKNYLKSEDIIFTIKACRELGAQIEERHNDLIIRGVNGKFPIKGETKHLFVGESGTSMRLLTALSVLSEGMVIIDGEKKLRKRPIEELIKALQNQGILIKSVMNNGCAPVEVRGSKPRGGEIIISSDKSSQFASALLLISPFAEKDVILKPVNIKSRTYLKMTWYLMKKFGILGEFDGKAYKIKAGSYLRAKEYTIEGDWTSASYFMVAAAISGKTLRIINLNNKSMQGDKKILSILSRMGCKITMKANYLEITGRDLNSVTIDLSDNPDLVPSLSIAAAYAKGTSKFTNISHLRFKESNRLESVCRELKRMGINAQYTRDQITISGGEPKGAVIDTHDDHRIAMSFSIAALKAKGNTVINNADVINKSYPKFFEDLFNIGAKISYIASCDRMI